MENVTTRDFRQIAEVFKGRSVFITGHSGFKGSWLSLWLAKLGAKVTGYSLGPPTEPSHFMLLKNEPSIPLEGEFINDDIRNMKALEHAFAVSKPEIVFHLAAQPLVRLSYSNPFETYSTNVMGTLNVLEACRKTRSVRAIVNVTSDKCYENREWLWGYRENEAMGGYDPYSSSKGCAEILTASYRRSFFSTDSDSPLLASARAGNVIGGGDWAADRLIPDIVRATIRKTPTSIRRPEAVRPWQHVLEPLHGYLRLASKLLNGDRNAADGWNFGPHLSDAKDVRSVALTFKEQWHKAEFEFGTEQTGPHEAGLLRLDITKAVSQLKWRPVLSFEESIRWTADWYRDWAESSQLRTLRQIAEFEERI